MNALPPIGSFIRPVGVAGYRYCIKVTHHFGKRVQGERWGMQDKHPTDDGHRSGFHGFDLQRIAAGVWKGVGQWAPLYWVVLDEEPDGQMTMFGALLGEARHG